MKKDNPKKIPAKFIIIGVMTVIFCMGILAGATLPEFSKNKPSTIEQSESQPIRTCEKVEQVLLQSIYQDDDMSQNYEARLWRAQVYAKTAEHGCPENQGKFKALAVQELTIARALTNDFTQISDNSVETVVDTYRQLNMQREIENILDKAKRLAAPVAHLFMEAERIFNE